MNGSKTDIQLPKQHDIEIHDKEDLKKAFGSFNFYLFTILGPKKPLITGLEFQNFQLAVRYVISDTGKHKKAFLIGFFTVFLVVFFIRYYFSHPHDPSLLQNAITKAPIIFVKLSEDQVGEYDLVLLPFKMTKFS